jgi:hypothetical protein
MNLYALYQVAQLRRNVTLPTFLRWFSLAGIHYYLFPTVRLWEKRLRVVHFAPEYAGLVQKRFVQVI